MICPARTRWTVVTTDARMAVSCAPSAAEAAVEAAPELFASLLGPGTVSFGATVVVIDISRSPIGRSIRLWWHRDGGWSVVEPWPPASARGGPVRIVHSWNGGPVEIGVATDETDAGPTVLLDVELTGVPLEEFELETGFAGIRFEGPPRQAKLHWNCGMSLDDARALRQALDDAIGD